MTDAEILALLGEETEDDTPSTADVLLRGATSVPSFLFGAAPAAVSPEYTYGDVLKSTALPEGATTPQKYLYRAAQGAVPAAAAGAPAGPVGVLAGGLFGAMSGLAGQAVEDLTGSPALGTGVEMLTPAGLPSTVARVTGGGFKAVDTGGTTAQTQQNIQALESEGLTGITRGQVSGDFGDKLIEQVLMAKEPSGAGARLVEGAIEQGRQVLSRIFAKSGVGDRVMVNPKVIAENAGKAWRGFVNKSVNEFHTNMQKVYDRVPNVQIDTMPLFEDVNTLMDMYKGNEQATKALKQVFGKIAQYDDAGNIVGLKPTTVKEFWNIKRSIADGMFKGGLKDNPFFALDAGEAAKIRRQILGSVYRTLDEAAASGNVGAEQLKSANAAYQAGVKQLEGLRSRPINDLLGEEGSKALQGGQWTEVVDSLKGLSPEDSRLFTKLLAEQDPDSLAMLRKSALEDVFKPFQKEATVQGGQVKTYFDLTGASPKQIMEAINASPLFKGTKEAKRMQRLVTKLAPAFRGTDPKLLGQVDAEGTFRQSMINVLADTAGTALPKSMAYRARYAILSAGASKRLFQALAHDPRMLVAIMENPKAERLFIRLTKDDSGYTALSTAAAAERQALLDVMRNYSRGQSAVIGGTEIARDETTVTDQELLQLLEQ